MATFSLGSGTTPGAPGVYINERAGLAASAAIADFSTVYMLVEAPESVPVTIFPFNTPIPITSLNDYLALVGGQVPEDRIPLLSYNCVNEFFQNAQIGDLRVVRVGTPDQIVEIEILPSGTRQSTAGLPSTLEAGETVYAQLVINGNRLVAGDGSTGYTASGEWLGVPVVIPVDYIPGDEVNNRKISDAIATAVAEAIESNPSIRSSVYVRDFGLVSALNPLVNSENGYITIAATTFDGNVNVVPQVDPIGAQYVFMQNVYDIQNIVGMQQELVRVPQDYIQCIDTAFDGQQDQGYLITPTAYAQFDAQGRASVGAAAADLCANNNYKWMALADPGPFLVTDINKYSLYTPHKAAADLVTGESYLVDNAIYKWIGDPVTYDKVPYQARVASPTDETAVDQSKNTSAIAPGEKVGLLDTASYSVDSISDSKLILNQVNWWPVSYQIQEVTYSNATGVILAALQAEGKAESGEIYVVAPPANYIATGDYSNNNVFFALTASKAVSVLNEVIAAGGSDTLTNPADALSFGVGTGECDFTYTTPFYDLPQTINGQTSNLIQNVSEVDQYINTLHLPATLQDPTEEYRLNFVSRTILDPTEEYNIGGDLVIQAGTGSFAGAAQIYCKAHGLTSGQKLYFTQPVKTASATLFRATTKTSQTIYYVKVVDANNFVLAESLTAYTAGSYIPMPSASLVAAPTIFYTRVLGGKTTSAQLAELSVIPFIRERKYGIDSTAIFKKAAVATDNMVGNIGVSVFLNDSATALGVQLISPWGEGDEAGWLANLELSPLGSPGSGVHNYYCTPTVQQNYASQAFLVPSIDPIEGGYFDPTVPTPLTGLDAYVSATGLTTTSTSNDIQQKISQLVGVYFHVAEPGFAPDGTTAVVQNDRLAVTYNGSTYSWVVVPDVSAGGDITTVGQPCYGSQIALDFTPEVTPPRHLWRFDPITSTEIISDALRGVGFNGVPQAEFVEGGIDNVNRLYNDSQQYYNPFGFIAFYGPYIQNASEQWIPPSPYVAGVAIRRYRAEGYQFPPAGVKYQLSDAIAAQIPINSAQQNLLNPDGCNAIRTLPGYPTSAVFIWGGRTRVNAKDAQQRLFQFVNTRVILNVVYGSLRSAFDSQIFSIIDGFGVAYNQIISVGNSVLNQLYIRGALYGARPSDAFQVICDNRINPPESLENGIINAKVFVTPVPTLERIQIDLIRVAIGQMKNELEMQGLGS